MGAPRVRSIHFGPTSVIGDSDWVLQQPLLYTRVATSASRELTLTRGAHAKLALAPAAKAARLHNLSSLLQILSRMHCRRTTMCVESRQRLDAISLIGAAASEARFLL